MREAIYTPVLTIQPLCFIDRTREGTLARTTKPNAGRPASCSESHSRNGAVLLDPWAYKRNKASEEPTLRRRCDVPFVLMPQEGGFWRWVQHTFNLILILVVTSATLLGTSALLLVTRSY